MSLAMIISKEVEVSLPMKMILTTNLGEKHWIMLEKWTEEGGISCRK